MKYLIALLLLLFSSSIHSQNTQWDSLLLVLNQSELSTAELDLLLTKYNKSNKSKNRIVIKPKIGRTLSTMAIQNLYRIERNQQEKKTKYYSLNVFRSNKKIIYLNLVEHDTGDIIIKNSTKEYDLVLKSHFDKWNTDFNKDHKYFNPSDLVVVGFVCGYGGTPPKKFYEMIELVQQKKKDELLNWCKSINPEIRCYGGIGMDYLKKKGIKIGEDVDRILEMISKDKTEIYTCSGCMYGIRETVKEMYKNGRRELNSRMKYYKKQLRFRNNQN